jgi:hypothetical protein
MDILCINQPDRDSNYATHTYDIPAFELHTVNLPLSSASISTRVLHLFNLFSTTTKVFPKVDNGMSTVCSNLILFGEYSFVVRLCFRVPQLSSVR